MSMLRQLGILIAALIGSMLGLILLLPLGLVVHELVIFPLALSIAALLAAIGGNWAGNWLTRDQTRTRLLPVVGVAEATAAALVLLFMAVAVLRVRILGPLLGVAVVWALTLALAATIATWRFRTAPSLVARDGRLTLLLLGATIMLVPSVVFLAWTFGLTGA
jgi:hypothetical protein